MPGVPGATRDVGGALNERQRYALEHVADDPSMILARGLRRERKHPRGFLLRSVLAVDR